MNLFKDIQVFAFVILDICTFSLAQTNGKLIMVYQETVCPPQWISYGNDKQTLVNLREELAKDSIKVYSLRIIGKPYEMTCAGCQCLTGRNVEIAIDPKDQIKLEQRKFRRPWVWMEKYELVCDWTMGLDYQAIEDSLINKGMRVQGLYCSGLSQKKEDCAMMSGRMLTLRVDKDDMDKAVKQGFILNKDFKQY